MEDYPTKYNAPLCSKLGNIAVHKDKMADASAHDEQMKNFVRAEIFMKGIDPQNTMRHYADTLVFLPNNIAGLCIYSIAISCIINILVNTHHKFFRKLGYIDCGGLVFQNTPFDQPMELFFRKVL